MIVDFSHMTELSPYRQAVAFVLRPIISDLSVNEGYFPFTSTDGALDVVAPWLCDQETVVAAGTGFLFLGLSQKFLRPVSFSMIYRVCQMLTQILGAKYVFLFGKRFARPRDTVGVQVVDHIDLGRECRRYEGASMASF